MLFEEKYPDGLKMKDFKWVGGDKCSYNYYLGFDNDLLLAESDDDDTTEWFLARPRSLAFQYLGESKCSRGELLTRYERADATKQAAE